MQREFVQLTIETRESENRLKCSLVAEILNSHDKERLRVKGSQATVVLFDTGATIGASVVDCAQALELTWALNIQQNGSMGFA